MCAGERKEYQPASNASMWGTQEWVESQLEPTFTGPEGVPYILRGHAKDCSTVPSFFPVLRKKKVPIKAAFHVCLSLSSSAQFQPSFLQEGVSCTEHFHVFALNVVGTQFERCVCCCVRHPPPRWGGWGGAREENATTFADKPALKFVEESATHCPLLSTIRNGRGIRFGVWKNDLST